MTYDDGIRPVFLFRYFEEGKRNTHRERGPQLPRTRADAAPTRNAPPTPRDRTKRDVHERSPRLETHMIIKVPPRPWIHYPQRTSQKAANVRVSKKERTVRRGRCSSSGSSCPKTRC